VRGGSGCTDSARVALAAFLDVEHQSATACRAGWFVIMSESLD
jgi:hypothetical protein